jgi:uncharacterized peroxidase-related enzyme
MNSLPLIEPEHADGSAKDLLDAVRAGMGVVPNLAKAMANSPALLNGYLSLAGALNDGVLSGPTRELIALAVAQANSCEYCLSAHTYLADHVAHLDGQAIEAARKADSNDPKTAAVLKLAATVVDTRGELPDGAFDEARAAGLTDEEIAETFGHTVVNILTNYFNKAANVEIDFPHVTA